MSKYMSVTEVFPSSHRVCHGFIKIPANLLVSSNPSGPSPVSNPLRVFLKLLIVAADRLSASFQVLTGYEFLHILVISSTEWGGDGH